MTGSLRLARPVVPSASTVVSKAKPVMCTHEEKKWKKSLAGHD